MEYDKHKERELNKESLVMMSIKHGAVGGAIISPPVIGPRDTRCCPISVEFLGVVCGNTQSEDSSSLCKLA